MNAVAVEFRTRKTFSGKPGRKKAADRLKLIQGQTEGQEKLPAKKKEPVGPTPERMAKMGEHFIRGDNGLVTARDAPLETLHAKDILDSRQYDAGKKFYGHWYRAGLNERFAALNLASGVFGCDGFAGGMPATEDQAFHREAYRKSVQHIGMRSSAILQQIVCDEKQPAQVGVAFLGWTNEAQGRAAAIELLRDTLDRLADLYGM